MMVPPPPPPVGCPLLFFRAMTPTLIRWPCHKRELAPSPLFLFPPSPSVHFLYDTMAPPLRGYYPYTHTHTISPPSVYHIIRDTHKKKKPNERNERRTITHPKKKRKKNQEGKVLHYTSLMMKTKRNIQMGIFSPPPHCNTTLFHPLFFFWIPLSNTSPPSGRERLCLLMSFDVITVTRHRVDNTKKIT